MSVLPKHLQRCCKENNYDQTVYMTHKLLSSGVSCCHISHLPSLRHWMNLCWAQLSLRWGMVSLYLLERVDSLLLSFHSPTISYTCVPPQEHLWTRRAPGLCKEKEKSCSKTSPVSFVLEHKQWEISQENISNKISCCGLPTLLAPG